ncbi:hypothetical protein [Salinibacillus xinjiangensis]|uniref:Uncharacterized protein n=1 Tax=Salinibacillus xinjiangensis TaxID=1229268 RepID=A0A6G1XAH9_9BACI|nr:hypothetical protein [Salinibacillus xinjiangensis]MRG87915.1 hypothetical protein [Salinibacillus xinjiangensis]
MVANQGKNIILSVVSFIIGIVLFVESYKLFSIESVDGTGIGVYVLGLQISDAVPKENLSFYAIAFLLVGMFLVITSVVFIRKIYKKR